MKKHALYGAAALALSGCGPLDCQLEACDIRNPSCQRAVMKSTACLRGREPANLPVRVLSRDAFADQLLQTELTEEQILARSETQTGLALFGLEDPNEDRSDAVRNLVATVGAYYDPGQNEIVIIEDGVPLDSVSYVTILAHEYAHALQWQHTPPDQSAYLTTDQTLAGLATTEGDAAWTQDRLYAVAAGRAPEELDWRDIHNGWASYSEALYRSQRSRVRLASRFFIYAFGSRYLKGVFDAGGQAAIDELIPSPPSSTLEVLRRQSIDLSDDRIALAQQATPQIAGAELLLTDELGWWIWSRGSLLGFALRSQGLAAIRFDWRGDALSLWAREGDRQLLAALRLRFVSTEQAERIHDALVSITDDLGELGWVVELDDLSVTVLASTDRDWLTELQASPPAWGPTPLEPAEAPADESSAAVGRAVLLCPIHPPQTAE